MRRRPLFATILLLACCAVLPACKKKAPAPDGGEPGPNPGSAPGDGPPPAVTSDYLLFAHINGKQIRENPIVTEIKQAFVKAGGTAEWDQAEAEVAKTLGGVKPTEIDSVTVAVTDFTLGGEPSAILILKASKPLVKTSVFGLSPQAKPDARGLYPLSGAFIHFPDDKTLVVLSAGVVDKYLAGYAKDRTTWPMTAELSKAAGGHTLYAVANLSKLPAELRDMPQAKMAGPLLSAKMVTVVADLKGKEISAAARVAFADAATAGKAKETVQGFIASGVGFIENFMNSKGKEAAENAFALPVVKEALRALKEAKVEVSGSELTVAGNYKANFDIGPIMVEAVNKVRTAAQRMKAMNNFKQIGISLHAYHDVYNQLLVHGTGAKGAPLKNTTDKPLLSWRVAILPYIEQQNLYNEFKLDEPWDSEHNKKLIAKMPKIYAPVAKPGKEGYTHLQMVIGPNAMQPGMKFPASISDGTSNTIAVVEAAEPVIWTKPDDVMLPGKEWPKDLKKKFGGEFPGGFIVALWDGSVRFVSNSTSDKTLAAALSPAGGEVLGSDW